jgi:hypothetical protein
MLERDGFRKMMTVKKPEVTSAKQNRAQNDVRTGRQAKDNDVFVMFKFKVLIVNA